MSPTSKPVFFYTGSWEVAEFRNELNQLRGALTPAISYFLALYMQ